MTTYLRPGVFVEETLQAINDPVTDGGTAVAAFVGTAKSGPVGPTLITSWAQYQALFGAVKGSNDDLAYGVYSFFNNGGSSCYVVRSVLTGATAADLDFFDADTDGAGTDVAEAVLTATAKAPGTWASDTNHGIYLTVVNAAPTGRFTLVVEVGAGVNRVAREQFDDLSLDPVDTRNALALVNSPTVGSKYVTLTQPALTGVFGTDWSNPVAVGPVLIGTTANGTAGSDGTGSPNYVTDAQRLDEVPDNLILNVPGVSSASAITDIINWADTRGSVFVVVDGPKPGATDDAAAVSTALTTLVSSLPKKSCAAVYGPWTYVVDPGSATSALRLIAPGAAVVGQYVTTDVLRGVWKTPAGVSNVVRGAREVHTRFTDVQLDTLNQSHVNVIRSVPGYGICIMGGRSLATGTPDRYVNVRRSLIHLRRALKDLTAFAVFEPNDEDLWATIETVIDQYLNEQWQEGMFRGSTPAQAFYVRCDETNNTDATVNSGVVNIEVGVALVSPAEFIVIRIGQSDGGAAVADTEQE